jgi:hypothetical protein
VVFWPEPIPAWAGKMPEEIDVPPVVVDVPHGMGVGDVTGPLGIVLAVVLGLDRFGLLRRNESGENAGGVPAHHRDEFVELRADVRHLQERVQEIRRETGAHRDRTAQALDSIRDAIRREIDK